MRSTYAYGSGEVVFPRAGLRLGRGHFEERETWVYVTSYGIMYQGFLFLSIVCSSFSYSPRTWDPAKMTCMTPKKPIAGMETCRSGSVAASTRTTFECYRLPYKTAPTINTRFIASPSNALYCNAISAHSNTTSTRDSRYPSAPTPPTATARRLTASDLLRFRPIYQCSRRTSGTFCVTSHRSPLHRLAYY